ncbi:MAG: hypothetical protein ACI8VC_002681 [Candidatus Endobugula sp.]
MTLDCILSLFPKEPLWYILIANILIPYLTYLFAHKNNVRLMKERWLSSFREEVSFLVSCVEENSELSFKIYKDRENISLKLEEEKVKLRNKMLASKIKIELLYQQENISDLKKFISEVSVIFEAANVSLNDQNEVIYVHVNYPAAQEKFLIFVRDLTKKYYSKIKK